MKFTKKLDVFKNTNFSIIYQLHVPKTSGQSISGSKWKRCHHSFNVNFSNTGNHDRKHPNYLFQFWPKQKYLIKENIKVAILRNPFDLLCSYYHHGVGLEPNKQYCYSGWGSVNYIHQFKSFEEFIRGYCDEEFEWHQPLFKQFLFSQLFNENGDCVPDILLKYEYLNESVQVMNKTWNLNLSRRVFNKSARKNHEYTFYYNNELIQLVNKKCKRELKIFKYNYENTLDDSYFVIPEDMKGDIKFNCFIGYNSFLWDSLCEKYNYSSING